jgi:hypothetical protein
MPTYTADVTWRTAKPLTEDTLFRFAELGGAASGEPGGRTIGATFTVEGATMPDAAASGLERLAAVAAGEPVSIEIMTHDEQDRRLAEPLTA